MALETRQNFTKGINRRFSREDSVNPEFFYTLQNARLFTRGDTGKVTRITGYSDFVTTGTTYTNTLDILEFKSFFVVLYEDAVSTGTFYVEIFNSSGVQQDVFNYSAPTASEGKLTASDDTVFIAPHNKILYYDNSSWKLEDFISEVPTITGTNQGSTTAASGSIQPTSGVDLTNTEAQATARLTIQSNNTVLGQPDTINVTVGGNQTDPITIEYRDSEREIAQEIFYALRGETSPRTGVSYSDPGIWSGETTPGNWHISLNKNQLNEFSGTSVDIYFTAVNAGSARNADKITIDNSKYNIIQEDTDGTTDRTQIRDIDGGTFDLVNTEVSTINISQPSGGADPGATTLGPLYIRINAIDHTVKTENIVSADTATTLTNKITTALNNDSIFSESYTATNNAGTVEIDANTFGKKFNGGITLKFLGINSVNVDDIFSYSKSDLSGGLEVEENLTLKPYTDYWYKARYKYLDGHVSEACFPIKLNTGASRSNTVNFDTSDLDLDGSRPKIQVFRKEEGGPFYLIDEEDLSGTTYSKLDDGIPAKDRFEDANLIWTKNHKTQTILDQRYVRANIEYNTEEYTDPATDGTDFALGTKATSSEESLPNNTRARFFIQPQYSDGTKGYFEEIGSLDVDNTGSIATIDQSQVIQNTDKNIEELGIFVNYKPHAEEYTTPFNSMEIANPNIPTIGDSSFYPSTTRVFFGFKYIEIWENNQGVVKVAGWDSTGTARDHGGFSFGEIDQSGSGQIGGRFPRTITVNVSGIDFVYVRYGYREADAQGENAVYRLANFEALKKAASSGDLKIRLTASNVGNLASSTPDDEILDTEVKVTSIIDTSSQYPDLDILREDDDVLIGPLDTRIYLELEESILDEIDNQNLTKYSFKRDYDDINLNIHAFKKIEGFPREVADVTSFTMSWEFTNFRKKADASYNPYTGDENANDNGRPETGAFGREFYRYDWDYSKYELTNITFLDDENTVIYLGRKENEDNLGTPVDIEVTGLKFKEENELQYTKLLPSNIYSKLVTKAALNLNKTVYNNQLIWSGKLRRSTGFTGGRTFRDKNFFNIGNENGPIIDIESLGNKLFVFCERGVAVVNVGEVLTQQESGQVYVSTENFMTNYYWISDKMAEIKRGSIKKYQNSIYFSDGYDVYRLSGEGLKNLSNGIVELDPNKEYYGLINPRHKEYQICDYTSNETWVFNLEFGQWYGPFTYKFKHADYLKNDLVMVDDSLYLHDDSNTFDGSSFTTLVESVANDTKASFYDKRYRKFYLAVSQDGTFGYGKTTSTPKSSLISTMIEKNGYKHQGIAPDESNNKVIYWDISTTNAGFELKDINWRFGVNRRR